MLSEGTWQQTSTRSLSSPPLRPVKPAGADTYNDITALHEGPHLAREDLVEGNVVTPRGEDRGIGGQGHSRQGISVHLEAVDQLGGYVLGIGGTSPVAKENKLPARPKGVERLPGRGPTL